MYNKVNNVYLMLWVNLKFMNINCLDDFAHGLRVNFLKIVGINNKLKIDKDLIQYVAVGIPNIVKISKAIGFI